MLCALLTGACFSAPPQKAALDARTPLREVLRERAASFMAGDVEGFLKNLSPLAREAEEPIARNAMIAEVSSLEFIVGESEPSPDGGLERVEIEWVYRYRGVPDDNVFRFRRLYRTKPEGNSVLIVDSSEDPASVPALWSTGPVAIHRTEHFLVLTRPVAPLITTFLPTAEAARLALLPKLEVEPFNVDDVYVAILAASDEEFTGYLRQYYTEGAVAVALSTSRASGSENREIVVNGPAVLSGEPVAYEDRAEVSGEEVVRHELGHLVLAKYTAGNTPAWVSEGAAMYLSGERREEGWRGYIKNDFAALSFGRLRDEPMLTGYQYPYANAGVLYLVEKFGPTVFWEFYQNIRRSGVDVGLTRFYRTEDDRLDVQVKAWVGRQVARLNPK